ncbi:MAG: response regulator, partial [Colwellia sp.]
YAAAKDDFYHASLLCPRELAFNLNLLQGLVDADLIFYKKVNTLEFLTELQNRELNEGNRKHLEEIVSLTIKKKDVYSIVNTSKGETNDNKSAD